MNHFLNIIRYPGSVQMCQIVSLYFTPSLFESESKQASHTHWWIWIQRDLRDIS